MQNNPLHAHAESLDSRHRQTSRTGAQAMAKIHSRRNKNPEIANIPLCATNPRVATHYRNNRVTYQDMASEIVGWAEFKLLDDNVKCAHCVEAAKIMAARQKAEKLKAK
jgi:hypothetical protein